MTLPTSFRLALLGILVMLHPSQNTLAQFGELAQLGELAQWADSAPTGELSGTGELAQWSEFVPESEVALDSQAARSGDMAQPTGSSTPGGLVQQARLAMPIDAALIDDGLQTADFESMLADTSAAGPPEVDLVSHHRLGGPIDGCDACDRSPCRCRSRHVPNTFGGADFLLVRPHFSEAVAFAQGNQTAGSYGTTARPIHFDYEGSVRAFVGTGFGSNAEALRLTYTLLQGDVTIGGGGVGPGQFIVDPFGNVVGTVTIIDPSDARFGTNVTGGDRIETFSSVETHVYDIDFTRRWNQCCGLDWRLDAGLRIADIDQTYRSLITLSGAPVSDGSFAVDFTGAGPHLGFAVQRSVGSTRRLAVAGSLHGALLLGDYDVTSGNNLGGGSFVAGQAQSQRKMVPVVEAEWNASWQASDALELSAGWLFHLWNDVGVSGGTFGGLFNGADDANNMSFDGLFLRAVLKF